MKVVSTIVDWVRGAAARDPACAGEPLRAAAPSPRQGPHEPRAARDPLPDRRGHGRPGGQTGAARPASQTGPLRPPPRARRLWPGLRGQHQGPQVPPDHRAGDPGAQEPRPPRRLRVGGQHRGRGRHPDPDAACLQRGGLQEGPHRPPRPRPLRQRHHLPAAQPHRAPPGRAEVRADGAVRGPARARLAHRTHEQRHARRDRALLRAVHAAGLHRAPGRDRRRPRFRAQALRDPQARLQRDPHLDDRGRRVLVHREPVGADVRLQGHAAHDAARPVFRRPAQPAHGDGAGAGALPVQHQHLPELGPRAPLSLHRPQRRDQHRPRQRELDARARGAFRGRVVRRRHPQDPPDHQPERQRLRHVRQHARTALPVRPFAAARRDDDDPRAVVQPRGHGRRQAGVLPVPLEPDGAVGRPGFDLVHRRHADRRRARPQRPAAGPLLRHEATTW